MLCAMGLMDCGGGRAPTLTKHRMCSLSLKEGEHVSFMEECFDLYDVAY